MIGYERVTTYLFEIDGEGYELTPSAGGTSATIAETRKSGHEDTHFSGEFWLESGVFVTDGCTHTLGEEYDHNVDGIIAHLTSHGIPQS